ncbi:MAG: L,D-transpeptidase family protein [Alphaproteobacteria bacterium]|uniref:L,D-transpeptidase family protein n=1 Tax=Hyphomonas sp. TaxID=87 RepID=UPI001D464BF0|nr:L,D-transpeptidase family protein [Hyphomonas sp.]MBU4062851.1 L,D-transpeptidase family protein [Alphaproteobacteria bacterium]MBU4163770.1 L,D-transpeptidase family protein [Alphaproteobacteria bacterium]MBU4568743.1 L,D-transpeptidase family protein [Alphaproteobacteria bacterium]
MILTHRLTGRLSLTRSCAARLSAAVLAAVLTGCAAAGPEMTLVKACPVAAHAEADIASCPEAAAVDRRPGAMRDALAALKAHGLDPAAYVASTADPEAAWRLAATHLRFGAVDPKTMAPRREADPTLAEGTASLPPESGAADYRAALEAMAPASPVYAALKAELARQEVVLSLPAAESDLAAAQVRIDSLRAGLERLRWLPRETTPRQVFANIPTFEVVAYSGDTEASRRAAIFGQLNRQTPEFSDAMEFIVFNPWWDVPESIARRDKLPQFRREPGAIPRLGYQVLDRSGNVLDAAAIDWASVSGSNFPYHIRQAPGPANALGQVKLIFPNPHNVYLHDTPDRSLFAQTQRTFSSGCIRVENPVALAGWVLEGTPGWDQARIDAALASGAETRATLAAPISVHVVYLTAFPAADGSVTYAPDVYGRDASLLTALAAFTAPAAGSDLTATWSLSAPNSGDCVDHG